MIMKWAKEQVEDAGGAGLGVGAAPAAAPHSTDQNFILLCTHLAHSLSVFHCIFSYYLFIYLFPFSLPRTFVASAAWIEYATPISTIFLVFHFKWIASSILFPRHHFIFKNKARNRFFLFWNYRYWFSDTLSVKISWIDKINGWYGSHQNLDSSFENELIITL